MVDINLKKGIKKKTLIGAEEEDEIKHIQKYHDCANLP